MCTLVLTVLVAASLAACGGTGSAAASETSLTITFRAQPGAEPIVRTLRCDPAGGTLANSARACSRLAAMKSPFAPTPKNVACTQIYGGPETARVTGSYDGRRIWATFLRRDGCEIDRWNRHAFLFPFRSAPGS
jgi:Subtilisin inhibitor-like